MKAVVALLCLVVAVRAASVTDSAPVPAVVITINDPFIDLIKEIEGSDFFPNLDLNDRLLTFEMLAAAETQNLKLLLDRLGYVVLLEYIDILPEDYQHRFVKYSVEHIRDENPDLDLKA